MLTADKVLSGLDYLLHPLPLLALSALANYTHDVPITPSVLLNNLTVTSALCRLSRYVSQRTYDNWTDDTFDWPGRELVVLTGGAQGLGAVIVGKLQAAGVRVAVLDIQPLTYVPDDRYVAFFPCDITRPDQVDSAAAAIRQRFGQDPTVLVNNAGITSNLPLLDTDPAVTNRVFQVNTLSHHVCHRVFVPSMRARNHGMVVTMASVTGYVSMPSMAVYSASKAAAIALHEGLRSELRVYPHTTHGDDHGDHSGGGGGGNGKGTERTPLLPNKDSARSRSRVRTILVTPGHILTDLFTGFDQGSSFFLPSLTPEEVADAVVSAMFRGHSDHITLPKAMFILPFLRALPPWVSSLSGVDSADSMRNVKQ